MKHQRNANSARKPSPKGHRIQRRSVTEKRQLLARYERSGLSQKAFCLRYGVALSTLQYWRRRARDTDQEPIPSFVEIPQVTGGTGDGFVPLTVLALECSLSVRQFTARAKVQELCELKVR